MLTNRLSRRVFHPPSLSFISPPRSPRNAWSLQGKKKEGRGRAWSGSFLFTASPPAGSTPRRVTLGAGGKREEEGGKGKKKGKKCGARRPFLSTLTQLSSPTVHGICIRRRGKEKKGKGSTNLPDREPRLHFFHPSLPSTSTFLSGSEGWNLQGGKKREKGERRKR